MVESHCPRCSAPVLPSHAFCGNCGAALAGGGTRPDWVAPGAPIAPAFESAPVIEPYEDPSLAAMGPSDVASPAPLEATDGSTERVPGGYVPPSPALEQSAWAKNRPGGNPWPRSPGASVGIQVGATPVSLAGRAQTTSTPPAEPGPDPAAKPGSQPAVEPGAQPAVEPGPQPAAAEGGPENEPQATAADGPETALEPAAEGPADPAPELVPGPELAAAAIEESLEPAPEAPATQEPIAPVPAEWRVASAVSQAAVPQPAAAPSDAAAPAPAAWPLAARWPQPEPSQPFLGTIQAGSPPSEPPVYSVPTARPGFAPQRPPAPPSPFAQPPVTPSFVVQRPPAPPSPFAQPAPQVPAGPTAPSLQDSVRPARKESIPELISFGLVAAGAVIGIMSLFLPWAGVTGIGIGTESIAGSPPPPNQWGWGMPAGFLLFLLSLTVLVAAAGSDRAQERFPRLTLAISRVTDLILPMILGGLYLGVVFMYMTVPAGYGPGLYTGQFALVLGAGLLIAGAIVTIFFPPETDAGAV